MLSGSICRLRAVEIDDIDLMYRWENDSAVWSVSGTVAPISHYSFERFVAEQQAGIYSTHQLRLIIESEDGRAVGAVDLYDLDIVNMRAGVGILVYEQADRRRGYGAEALTLLCDYARQVLRLHQLWCGVAADNRASLALFRRVGFRRMGRNREWLVSHDGWVDEIRMQKIL